VLSIDIGMAKSHFQKQKEKFPQDEGQSLPRTSKENMLVSQAKRFPLARPSRGKRCRLNNSRDISDPSFCILFLSLARWIQLQPGFCFWPLV
jgi:hypothetical protein